MWVFFLFHIYTKSIIKNFIYLIWICQFLIRENFINFVSPNFIYSKVKFFLYIWNVNFCLFIYLFIYLSIYLLIYLSINLFIYLSIYLFIYLSIHLFIYYLFIIYWLLYLFMYQCYTDATILWWLLF